MISINIIFLKKVVLSKKGIAASHFKQVMWNGKLNAESSAVEGDGAGGGRVKLPLSLLLTW